MPIRFQVDGDFYDHPKSLDLSDAAVALWTRAGSYSAHKHLDGFVPDGKLASLVKGDPIEASAELVRARLWKRVRGGYQFHQWNERNLTKAEIDAEREYERDRKRQQRRAQRERNEDQTSDHRGTVGNSFTHPVDNPRADPTAQVNGVAVPEGHPRDKPGTSTGTPNRSVSVSVSESVSERGGGSARRETHVARDPGPEPPLRCSQHQHDDDPPPCGKCAGARQAHEAWERANDVWQRERQHADAAAKSAAAKAHAEGVRAAIDACPNCDQTGYRDGRLCHHTASPPRRAA